MRKVESLGKYYSPGEELAIELLTAMSVDIENIRNEQIEDVVKKANEIINNLDKKLDNLDDEEKKKFFAFIKGQEEEITLPITLKTTSIFPVFNKFDKERIIVLFQCEDCPKKDTCDSPLKKKD